MKKWKLDWTFWLGTDAHQYLIYHPADVAHLGTDWVLKKSIVQKELAAGRLLSFTTSGAGEYQFRLTNGPLTPRESRWRIDGLKWRVSSCDFRLVVSHERLFIDNAESIPGRALAKPEDRKRQWFEIPNGKYRVIVYGLKWYEEPGGLDATEKRTPEALPDYVICFESVADLETITPAKAFPAIW